MSRWSLAFVAFWAMALTMHGSPSSMTPSVSAGPVSATSDAVAAAGGIDSDAVARIIGSWNPILSTVERQRIGDAVVACQEHYDLDPTLVTAMIWVESRGRPWARSPKGALGLMQVMPYMAEPFGLAGNFTTIESNVEAGCRILSDNIERLGEADGVSAYFWGSNIRGASYLNRVEKARERVREALRS